MAGVMPCNILPTKTSRVLITGVRYTRGAINYILPTTVRYKVPFTCKSAILAIYLMKPQVIHDRAVTP